MITSMLNMVNTIFQTPQAKPAIVQPKSAIENPFASPFIQTGIQKNIFESRNQPVKGGYFAGYYNGKKNIVGRRLFISV